MSLFATKTIEQIRAEQLAQGEHSLKRVLGPLNLLFLGVGAVIGTGIFVLTGQAAAANAGPAIVLSMVIAGLASALAGRGYAALAAAVAVARLFIDTANWQPFVPPNEGPFGVYGWSGVFRGAAVVFFAYIGFDAVSTSAQEARHPQRDMPRGILGSLAICTILFVLVSGVMVGLVHYRDMLNQPAPLVVAIQAASVRAVGPRWAALMHAVQDADGSPPAGALSADRAAADAGAAARHVGAATDLDDAGPSVLCALWISEESPADCRSPIADCRLNCQLRIEDWICDGRLSC